MTAPLAVPLAAALSSAASAIPLLAHTTGAAEGAKVSGAKVLLSTAPLLRLSLTPK